MVKAQHIVFENEDHYQKQTYRNRMHIYGANGLLPLHIPIRHNSGSRQHQKYKDVRIANDFPWQKQHWKSFESAYRTSPFFEYYEDDLINVYTQKHEFLLEFNYQCMAVVFECLQHKFSYTKTTAYHPAIDEPTKDLRILANAKKPIVPKLDSYPQVFDSKKGFLSNLSILDLLFNQGTNTLSYLEEQDLSLPAHW